MSLKRASIAGLLYAVVMCTWRAFTSDDSMDSLMIKFAVYFGVFTTGFWILYNLFATWKANRD